MPTKSESSEIAVLQTQMEEVKGTLVTIQANQQVNFDHLAAKMDALSMTTAQVKGLEDRLKVVEAKKSPIAAAAIGAGVAGSIFAYLIQYALTHR